MKKILSAVAALGLVAGMATVAAAADLSVTGKYVVEGIYVSNAGDAADGRTIAGGANPFYETASDSFYMHTFQLLPTMKVNDSITMKSDIRFRKEARFGVAAENGGQDTAAGNISGVDFNKIYMEYASPIGKITVGRTPAGAWGTPFLDSATAADRIMWAPNMVSAPWSVLLYTQKTLEADSQNGGNNVGQDTDQYHVGVGYSTDNTTVKLGVFNNRFQATDLNSTTYDLMGVFKFGGNYSLVADLVHVGGDVTATTSWDADGALLMGTGQFDNLTASLAYVYASGEDTVSADTEALMANTGGLGKDFQPLYIFTGDAMHILNQDEKSGSGAGVAAANAGVHCYALMADYKVSDRLTLHGAIAYGEADETLAYGANVDDSFGMEYNIGAAYKLVDNLTYEAHFGYVDAGDFFKLGNAADRKSVV